MIDKIINLISMVISLLALAIAFGALIVNIQLENRIDQLERTEDMREKITATNNQRGRQVTPTPSGPGWRPASRTNDASSWKENATGTVWRQWRTGKMCISIRSCAGRF